MKTQAPAPVKTQQTNQTNVAQGPTVHQAKAEAAFVDNRQEAIAQRRLQAMMGRSPQAMQLKAYQEMTDSGPRSVPRVAETSRNNTGLPDGLKEGVESLSGMRMDHVKVHYNSAQPAQLHAHAYAQGNEIHIAPGQERHLPHEAWHVVQQAQGRVKSTMQMKADVSVNDDAALETEADVMGARALQLQTAANVPRPAPQSYSHNQPVQRRLRIGAAAIAAAGEVGNAQIGDAEARAVVQVWIRRHREYVFPDWDQAVTTAQEELNALQEYRDNGENEWIADADANFTEAEVVNLHAIDEEIFGQLDAETVATAKAVSDAYGIGAIELLWTRANDNFADALASISSENIGLAIAGLGATRFADLLALAPLVTNWIHLTEHFSYVRIGFLPDDVVGRLLATTDANRQAIGGQWDGLRASLNNAPNATRVIGRLNLGDTAADLSDALNFPLVTPFELEQILAVCANLTAVLANLRMGITNYGLGFNQVLGVCQANPNQPMATLEPLFQTLVSGMNPVPKAAIYYLAANHGIANPALLQINYRESRRTVNERAHGGSYHIFDVTVVNVVQPQQIHCHVTGTAFNSASANATQYKNPNAGGQQQSMGGPIIPAILGLVTAGNYNQQGTW
jgi:hypothetical protein